MSSHLANTPRRVRRSAILLVLLLVVALMVVAGILYTVQMLGPVTGNKNAPSVLVYIPPGKSARQIGQILARKHLIRSSLSFVFASRMGGLSGQMHAGHYELSPAMPPRQIAALMALGETAQGIVTVPEGFTARQIASRLAQHGLANEQQFLTLAQTQGRTFHVRGWTPPNDNLEGYLFPDTYSVPKGAAPRDIVQMMLENFDRRVAAPLGPELNKFPGGLPAAVTLASLVEREAEVDTDRPLIAAVYLNRLNLGMRLQCDATVQYALPEHKARLHYSDYRVDSPYNTYLHGGLPPTPIANPGLPSIEAALRPASNDYLFYVAGPGGRHIFTKTLGEHQQAVAHIRAGQ
ncbi:MAG: endolytic transglycosylase MltG [Armatimonadota bacterium]|nr:endolytic transglycosylase MltG [Armatimonadota bacterium]